MYSRRHTGERVNVCVGCCRRVKTAANPAAGLCVQLEIESLPFNDREDGFNRQGKGERKNKGDEKTKRLPLIIFFHISVFKK